ncbi:MAG TPA: mitomycin resistance protein [Desulfocapsa sulfexigens]|nr:mitomycin resistance protein [Desulfocapsa sulfexigens]HIQ37612.1 mitomycin resistance protein [Desulfocapsa sulfexigens]
MKSPNRKTVSDLEQLPNIGKAMARDLRLLGINSPQQLIGKDAYRLHDELCRLTGTKTDPCVIDVFLSVVHFMEGGEALPWWDFTEERKRTLLR